MTAKLAPAAHAVVFACTRRQPIPAHDYTPGSLLPTHTLCLYCGQRNTHRNHNPQNTTTTTESDHTMTDEIEVGGLARIAGDSFKFEKVGDTLKGTITQVQKPFTRTSDFTGQLETVYPIGITPDGGTQVLIWPQARENGPTAMLSAIVEAVVKANCTTYAVGGRLAVRYNEDRDTGKPSKMKVYVAQYEPPSAKPAAVPVDDLF